MEMENNEIKSLRRNWTSEETKAFLDTYSKRKFEFESARLKKFAMANVLEDLMALGILSRPTTVEMLNVKLKNLLRAFKATNDKKKRTGESSIKAPFEEQMEEIFGSQPIIRNSHTINLTGKAINSLPIPMKTKDDILSESESNSDASSVPYSSAPSSTGQRKLSNTCKQKRLDLKQKIAAERNKILAEYTENKLKKMDEAEKGREARYLKNEALLRELFKK